MAATGPNSHMALTDGFVRYWRSSMLSANSPDKLRRPLSRLRSHHDTRSVCLLCRVQAIQLSTYNWLAGNIGARFSRRDRR
jgi:hypothetical protein